jgi:hypothetical protein
VCTENLDLYEVPRNPAAEKKIRNAVIQFWLDVRDGKEPDADYGKDKDLIAALSDRAKGRTQELRPSSSSPPPKWLVLFLQVTTSMTPIIPLSSWSTA